MKKIKFVISLFFIVLLLFSCKNGLPDNGEDLISYVNDPDNGYRQAKTVNGIQVDLTYRPAELMVSQEQTLLKNNSQEVKDSLKNKYKDYYYFLLTYTKDGNEILSTVPRTREEFNTIQNNLSFNMHKLVCLTNRKDTLQFLDFNSPRTYGMSKSTNVLLVFKKDHSKSKGNTFKVNVQDIGVGTGDLSFTYPSNLLLD
ncbi:hypothetical protein NAT51_15340 [Flavobacterium amniphilum]|uniref:hypothetical protein n=1 Tax=Flavobacterium amniphilum TaxID=1834035 RepID=UPI00202A857C|nr:hypothetical protein [Flavobacterium amniphilum]MCL9806909.1 hypothetical protein [Flavobacterium amniphilum]